MGYKRKTEDEFQIHVNYGFGWEHETTEETYREGLAQLKCYRENISYPVKLVIKRVKCTS